MSFIEFLTSTEVAPRDGNVLITSDANASNDQSWDMESVPVLASVLARKKPGGSDRAGRFNVEKLVPAGTWVKQRCRRDSEYTARYKTALEAARLLKLTQIQKLYPREYNSYRGAKERSRIRHQPMSTELKNFRHWLSHVGVHPEPESMVQVWSVDCSSRSKGYTIGNLRWADRKVQNENRSSSKWVTLPDGKRLTIKQFAQFLGQSYATIYKSLKGGKQRRRHSATELISKFSVGSGLAAWKLPTDDLEREYQGDFFKGRRHTRISWYLAKLSELIDHWHYELSQAQKSGLESAQSVAARKLKTLRDEEQETKTEFETRCQVDQAKKNAFVDLLEERRRVASMHFNVSAIDCNGMKDDRG